MSGGQSTAPGQLRPGDLGQVETMAELASVLRQLRRRHARQCGDSALTYRELAAKTGWAVGIVGDYFTGKALAPTDRFDVLVGLLGATAAEQGMLATARDRVDEQRRGGPPRGARIGSVLPVPRQLPADVFGFTGRERELSQLDALLEEATRPNAPAVAISAVSGTPGVGKSALAVHWAHRVADQFPDGQLYVNLRGFDPAGSVLDPDAAIRGFLEALDIPSHRIPVDAQARAALYRSSLAGKRMLVLLDNARDVDHVRPLLPGWPGCLAVVTSRNQLAGLIASQGAQPITVDLLGEAEARDLLAGRLGPQRVAAEPAAVDEIITHCARLPLALAIVAARAVTSPGFPLATLAAELRHAAGGLEAFTGQDPTTEIRAVFSWSYRTLSTQAARLFRLLGPHPGQDIGVVAAASLAAVPPREAARLLTELAGAHLIEAPSPGRYAFHDLLRAYANGLVHTYDSAADRHAATHRVLDYYLHTAHAAVTLLYPHVDPIPLDPPPPGITPARLVDPAQAVAWFTAEQEVLVAALTTGADAGFDTHVWRLASCLGWFLDRRGQWDERIAVLHAALGVTQRLADRGARALVRRQLGGAYARAGRYHDADPHLRQAIDLYAGLSDHVGQAETHMTLGFALESRGRYDEALSHAQDALELFRTAGHRVWHARALNTVGWCHALLGNHQPALANCHEALEMLQQLGDHYGEANTWHSLGHVHHQLDQHEQAITCYHHAVDLYRGDGDRYFEADTLVGLGDARHAAGDPDAARDAWQQAAAILDELEHPDADRVKAKIRKH